MKMTRENFFLSKNCSSLLGEKGLHFRSLCGELQWHQPLNYLPSHTCAEASVHLWLFQSTLTSAIPNRKAHSKSSKQYSYPYAVLFISQLKGKEETKRPGCVHSSSRYADKSTPGKQSSKNIVSQSRTTIKKKKKPCSHQNWKGKLLHVNVE